MVSGEHNHVKALLTVNGRAGPDPNAVMKGAASVYTSLKSKGVSNGVGNGDSVSDARMNEE